MSEEYTNKLRDILGTTRYHDWYTMKATEDGSRYNWLSEEKIEELAKDLINKIGEKDE
tara:strand:+ start:611 stop:784 length:174 start_codon:yes stop_codon:yes gene_type:complete